MRSLFYFFVAKYIPSLFFVIFGFPFIVIFTSLNIVGVSEIPDSGNQNCVDGKYIKPTQITSAYPSPLFKAEPSNLLITILKCQSNKYQNISELMVTGTTAVLLYAEKASIVVNGSFGEIKKS